MQQYFNVSSPPSRRDNDDEDIGRFSNLHQCIFNNLRTIQLTFINLYLISKQGVKYVQS